MGVKTHPFSHYSFSLTPIETNNWAGDHELGWSGCQVLRGGFGRMAMEKPILIVDDDPSIVELLTAYLRRAGYKTVSAGDGRQGLLLTQQQRPNIILADWNMPGMNGLELCRAIRADHSIGKLCTAGLTG